jgi:Lrp/AsnC family transcriptional regulator, leucine-responsive regulatory protein
MNSKSTPDHIDWKILELLQQNARLSNTEMGKLVGLSQPAVTARIQKLEDSGAIDGYTARLNPRCLGREISAFIRLKTTYANISNCLKTFEQIPHILEVYRITGEDCFLVKATFQRMSQLESTIDAMGKLGAVTTAMILAPYPPKPLTDTNMSQELGHESKNGAGVLR